MNTGSVASTSQSGPAEFLVVSGVRVGYQVDLRLHPTRPASGRVPATDESLDEVVQVIETGGVVMPLRPVGSSRSLAAMTSLAFGKVIDLVE